MKKMKNNLMYSILFAGTTVGFLSVSGCSSPPTQKEINDTYRYFTQQVDEAFESLKTACESLEGEARENCLESAIAWHRENRALAITGWHDATNQNWVSARENAKLLEAELLEMLPNWPDIQSILTIQGILTGDEGPGYPRYTLQQPLPSNGNIGAPVPIIIRTFNFSGDISIERDGFDDPASCVGEINMYFTSSGPQTQAVISSGSFTASFDNDQEVELTIIKSPGSTFNLNANGEGHMVFRVKVEHTMEQWDSILPDTQRVYLPVRFDPIAQNFIIDSNDSDIESIAPYQPVEFSDYNNDDVLEYSSDYTAYLIGHAANEDRADINKDSVWDQEDIDVWNAFFALDQEHAQ